MTEEEYRRLQNVLMKKMKEGNIKYPHSPARAEAWEEAFLCMKSIIHSQFKPKEVMTS